MFIDSFQFNSRKVKQWKFNFSLVVLNLMNEIKIHIKLIFVISKVILTIYNMILNNHFDK